MIHSDSHYAAGLQVTVHRNSFGLLLVLLGAYFGFQCVLRCARPLKFTEHVNYFYRTNLNQITTTSCSYKILYRLHVEAVSHRNTALAVRIIAIVTPGWVITRRHTAWIVGRIQAEYRQTTDRGLFVNGNM